MSHSARFRELGAALAAFEPLWRPKPWHERRPGWCEAYPALERELLALDDAALERLAADDAAILGVLARHVPEVAEVAALTRLPVLPASPLRDLGPHFDWRVPGRKRAQVQAFAAAVGRPLAPVVDWCAGKGHLGRFVAAQWGVPVCSVERDEALVAEGEGLARRARQEGQRFETCDVCDSGTAARLDGCHALALHACGDLHCTLVRAALDGGVTALDLSPCCPHKTRARAYEPFSGPVPFALAPEDLQLAVTGAVTAPARQRRQRRQLNAWKLGWLVLAEAGGGRGKRGLRPLPSEWLALGFEGFCRRLAEREGVALASATDWAAVERQGWARAALVGRLGLVRFGFRRALEVWLALDMAQALDSAGFQVRLGEFCPRALTPRNLLLSARRD